MPVRFLINARKPGVDPAEYERWLRKCDSPWMESKPNYRDYTVHPVRGPIASARWQYLERIEVESLEPHDHDLASPEGQVLRAEWRSRTRSPLSARSGRRFSGPPTDGFQRYRSEPRRAN